MIFNAKFTLLAFVAVAVAQSSSPSGSASPAIPSGLGISTCILNCVQPAATKVGCAFTNTTCVCTSAQFQSDATACLKANCTADEVTAALTLQQTQCKGLTPNGSSSGTPSGTSPATSTSPATTSNAASGVAVGGILAIAAGLLGIAGL
ncbi:hypothetical protein P691DRAFT_777104 [Macrolepiota fuliginosa MF-IS2]|uniref:CFEM domain-containing protein n=1 Tax=Macrolepiota fuliginosa MF-IS2 TaxID=1400762 RepID=A0A9P5X7U3_9AGAR|nr:hypothetical protein P691DRAFT_777104 [Macrolepiota fuliginosa MF-IS2]